MSNSYREVTHVGWFSRIGESIKGVLVGLVLVLIAVGVLFWNEGRSVYRAKTLAEGAKVLVSATPGNVDSANQGKLIHLSGNAESPGTLRDPVFGVEARGALRLLRHVEMYQWVQESKSETKRNVGGSEERVTTYSYKQAWRDDLVDSSEFKQPGFDNPRQFRYRTEVWNATDASIGAFKVNDAVLAKLTPEKTLSPQTQADTSASLEPGTLPATLPATLPSRSGPLARLGAVVSGNQIYLGNPSNPAIGDHRIDFKIVPSGPLSIIAQQAGDSFGVYITANGPLMEVRTGTHTAEAMFQMARDENRTLTWIIRGVGYVVIAIGFALVLAPLKTVADVVPFIGSIVGAGTGIAAMIMAIPVWLMTVAIAWLFYRPLLGIGMIALAIAIPVGFMMLRKSKAPPALPTR